MEETSVVRAERPSAAGITVVVPAYNEMAAIAGVVDRLCALELGVPTTVLVVNDGSEDDTGRVLEELKERHANLTVVEHAHNRGYGAALKTGIARAKTGVVVITDADGTYPEERIVDLLSLVGDYLGFVTWRQLADDTGQLTSGKFAGQPGVFNRRTGSSRSFSPVSSC